MPTITPNDLIRKLPVTELQASLETFLEPLTARLPDARLPAVVRLLVQGIVASESPLVTQIARGARESGPGVLMTSKRGYRLLANERLSHRLFLKGLYSIAQRTVAQQTPRLTRVVVALDPVNFEKPYTKQLEGVSIVRKSTPPNLEGEARLTRGYPAITATLVNTAPAIPVLSLVTHPWYFLCALSSVWQSPTNAIHTTRPRQTVVFLARHALHRLARRNAKRVTPTATTRVRRLCPGDLRAMLAPPYPGVSS